MDDTPRRITNGTTPAAGRTTDDAARRGPGNAARTGDRAADGPPLGRLADGTPRGTANGPARVVGRLDDGTPVFAPIGELLVDGDRVCCHLCGRWYLSVASHLRVHGWTKAGYLRAFGLELTNPLSGPATSKRRAPALGARHHEPAIRRAQGEARRRTRRGRAPGV